MKADAPPNTKPAAPADEDEVHYPTTKRSMCRQSAFDLARIMDMQAKSRRNETLARGSTPQRSRDCTTETSLQLFNRYRSRTYDVYGNKRRKHSNFARPSPMKESKRILDELDRIAENWINENGDDDDGETENGETEDGDGALSPTAVREVVRSNISSFDMMYSMATTWAEAVDRGAQVLEDEEEARKRAHFDEVKRMAAEDRPAFGARVVKLAKIHIFGAAKGNNTNTLSILTFAKPEKVTDTTRAVKRFYEDFFYAEIADSSEPVDVPAVWNTLVFQTVLAKHGNWIMEIPEARGCRQKKRQTMPTGGSGMTGSAGNRWLVGDDDSCPNCPGEVQLIPDSMTGMKSCPACALTFDTASRFRQSFAERQASSLRTTAPYVRISHVSSEREGEGEGERGA
jgi:hypothetical protein